MATFENSSKFVSADERLQESQLQSLSDPADSGNKQFSNSSSLEVWTCPACQHTNTNSSDHCENCYHSHPLPIEYQNLRCDECHLQPIIGSYYRCTVRTFYLLCPKCEKQKGYQPYPMIKVYEANHQKLSMTTRFEDGGHFTQTISSTITPSLPPLPPSPSPSLYVHHPHLPHLHNHLFPILHNEANIDSFSHLEKSQSKEMASNTVNPMITRQSLPAVKTTSFHRHKKQFKEFHALHLSKQEASNHMMKVVKIVDVTKTLSYWIGFYDLSHDISVALKAADLLTVGDIGKIWHEYPEGIKILLEDIYTDKEERSRLIRALNDAEELLLLNSRE